LIIGDGQNEKWYLQAVKRTLANKFVRIEPVFPGKSSIVKQQNIILDNVDKPFNKIFWIVDLDQILHQNQLEYLRKAVTDLSKKYDKIEILINNPCLELWFLLHFEYTAKIFPKCNDVITSLKKYLNDYAKTEKYFLNPRSSIFEKLQDKTPAAIAHAKRLGNFD